MALKVPVVDMAERFRSVKEEIKEAVLSVFESGQFILGPEVKKFEAEVAEYMDVGHTIGVASGTDALHLALLACGIGAGDEVITSPFTFVATVEAIAYTGATPVLVDILPDSYNLDPKEIEKKITKRTKAVIPVHMYGQAAEMETIMALAGEHGLRVIEDAAQAFGAKYKEKKLGGIGDIGCTSFFPTKNLGGAGDGGMVFTNDKEITERIGMLRVHGSKTKYVHELLGFNSRLDALQAAVLRVHLKYIDKWNELRREHAQQYYHLLHGEEGIILPKELSGNEHVYHLYSVRIKEREACQNFLAEKGVSTAIHYPILISEQQAFRHLDYTEKDLPVSSLSSKEVLSLPMYPELRTDQIEYVCECLRAFLKGLPKIRY